MPTKLPCSSRVTVVCSACRSSSTYGAPCKVSGKGDSFLLPDDCATFCTRHAQQTVMQQTRVSDKLCNKVPALCKVCSAQALKYTHQCIHSCASMHFKTASLQCSLPISNGRASRLAAKHICAASNRTAVTSFHKHVLAQSTQDEHPVMLNKKQHKIISNASSTICSWRQTQPAELRYQAVMLKQSPKDSGCHTKQYPTYGFLLLILHVVCYKIQCHLHHIADLAFTMCLKAVQGGETHLFSCCRIHPRLQCMGIDCLQYIYCGHVI